MKVSARKYLHKKVISPKFTPVFRIFPYFRCTLRATFMDQSEKTILALALGIVAGTVAGMLLAPSSGNKSRKKLSQQASQAKKEVENAWDDRSNRVHNVTDDTLALLENLSQKLSDRLAKH